MAGLPTANNYPRKGTKSSNWEGGIRGSAFVSGGYCVLQYKCQLVLELSVENAEIVVNFP